MITPNDLELVKDLIEKNEEHNINKELNMLLEKVNILIEFDKLNLDYQIKKQELSTRLQELTK